MLHRVPPIDADAVAMRIREDPMRFGAALRPSRFALFAVLALMLAVISTPPVSATTPSLSAGATTATVYSDGTYIVTFFDEPVTSYEGYLGGFPATRPQAGRKLDPDSPAVLRWQQHLVAQHDAALAAIGATKLYDYTITNNGVAAYLTGNQATRLAKAPGVIDLTKDQLAQPDTTLSPHFLGLDAAGGLWSQLGGAANAGAGVVVGVIDTGIWPESAAFAGGTNIPIPADWHGKCVPGQQWAPTTCNDKLIGARYYTSGFGIPNISTSDYRSARDGSGHGSHTLSTAAGNFNTTVTIDGYNLGTASGMAPGAKLAMYKVCWEGRGVPA